MMYRYKYSVLNNSYTILLKKKKSLLLYIFSRDKIFKQGVLIEDNDVFFDKNTQTVVIKTNKLNNINEYSLYKYNSYIINLVGIFYKKIKFSGKGFKISSYKKKKAIKFIFGHSHMTLLICRALRYKRLGKTKYIFFSKNKDILVKTATEIKFLKKINLYTLRGLRISKMKIIKRKGRKSPNI